MKVLSSLLIHFKNTKQLRQRVWEENHYSLYYIPQGKVIFSRSPTVGDLTFALSRGKNPLRIISTIIYFLQSQFVKMSCCWAHARSYFRLNKIIFHKNPLTMQINSIWSCLWDFRYNPFSSFVWIIKYWRNEGWKRSFHIKMETEGLKMCNIGKVYDELLNSKEI